MPRCRSNAAQISRVFFRGGKDSTSAIFNQTVLPQRRLFYSSLLRKLSARYLLYESRLREFSMPWPRYEIPDLPWHRLMSRIAAAEDTLARLDERLLKSEIREGWITRTHFLDACASLWVEGDLVHVEDLVLHDAEMDVRTPTHALSRAYAVLRARLKIERSIIAWPMSRAGFTELSGRNPISPTKQASATEQFHGKDFEWAAQAEGEFGSALQAIDAAVDRSSRILDVVEAATPRDGFVYDENWQEGERLDEWLSIAERTNELPPVLAAAIVEDAWNSIEPLEHAAWTGRLMAPVLLKFRKKTSAHLALFNVGLRTIPREFRRSRDPIVRYLAGLDALIAGAQAGLRHHESWTAAKLLLTRKLRGRRSTSHLPALIDFIVARPLVSAAMIADELGVSRRAAQDLVVELGVREMTGRGRFRAWGIV